MTFALSNQQNQQGFLPINKLIVVPGGKMLRQHEDGRTHALLMKSFLMDSHLVTINEFEEFVQQSGFHADYDTSNETETDHPVTNVSWNDAKAYAQWAGKRLPTENELEWASRNASNIRLSLGWNLIEEDNSLPTETVSATYPVGYFGKNQLGIYDLTEHVWQWTNDLIEMDNELKAIIKTSAPKTDYYLGFGETTNAFGTTHKGYATTGFRCAKDLD